MKQVLALAERHKAGYTSRTISVPGQRKAVKEVSASDLALIQTFAVGGREVTAGDVAVFEMDVCNDGIDRDVEKFSQEILDDFASTLPGKGWLIGHQWGPPGVGRVFRCSLQDRAGMRWVTAGCYIPVLGNEKFINDVELGVACYVSIGFFAPDLVEIQGPQGMYWEYRRGPNGERAEAIEVSSVFLGAQYDAAITKGVMKGLREKSEHPELQGSLMKALAQKSAGGLPFAIHGELGKAAKDRAWDPDAALKRVRQWASTDSSGAAGTIDFAKYVQAFAWRDAERMEALAGYRILHHDVEQGALVHQFEGSVRALAALFGRDHADLDDADRKDVFEHLVAEFGVFGETAPAWDQLEKIRGRLLAATDVDVVGIEAELGKACRGGSGAATSLVDKFVATVTKAARDLFGRPDVPAHPTDVTKTPAVTKNDAGEEGEMDELKKQIEALQAQLAASVKQVADLATTVTAQAKTIAALKTKDTVEPDGDGKCPVGYEKGDDGMCHLKAAEPEHAKLLARVTALEGKVTAVESDLGDLVGSKDAAGKDVPGAVGQVLDRIETIEKYLGASKAAPDEDQTDDKPADTGKGVRKTNKGLFGGMFAPAELAGRLK